jgi:hypothetical protein
MRYYLTIRLISDATFGRGDGTAGLVDTDIEHDASGLPFVGGRVIKGLLVEEYANLRFALGDDKRWNWDAAATTLFGQIGADASASARMRVGRATLPPDLCDLIRHENRPAATILAACTAIRRQSSMDVERDAPDTGSLRAMRVLVRETELIAPLDVEGAPLNQCELGLLAACVLATRRGGTARNRGRGRLRMLLHNALPNDYRDETFTKACFAHFAHEVRQ